MKPKNKGSHPIKLVSFNNKVIWKSMYVICVITHFYCQLRNGVNEWVLDLVVAKGKYKGLKVSTTFNPSYRSRKRLSHLCAALGIYCELESPEMLVGRMVRIRIVPKRSNYMGKNYLNYSITRFHSVDRNL